MSFNLLETTSNYSGSSPDAVALSYACSPLTDLFYAFAVIGGYEQAATVGCSDTVNGLWNQICFYFDSGYQTSIAAWWMRSNASGTPTVNLTWSGSGTYGANFMVTHANGLVNGAVIDVASPSTGTYGVGSVASFGPYTTAFASELMIVSVASTNSNDTLFTPAVSGYTEQGVFGPGGTMTQVVSSIQAAQTFSGTLTNGGSQNWDLVFATFSDTFGASNTGITPGSGADTLAGQSANSTPATNSVLTPITAYQDRRIAAELRAAEDRKHGRRFYSLPGSSILRVA